jgi:hypothetical protein
MAISPSDCAPGRTDDTCQSPLNTPPPFHGWTPPPPISPVSIGEIPAQGYWYFGYDFQTPDSQQLPLPQFVNRSGRDLVLQLTFTVPQEDCGKDCLPGVEFRKGSNHIYKIDPPLKVKGSQASASLEIANGESYSWVIGLWQSTNPMLSVTDRTGVSLHPEVAGLSARPDIASPVGGSTTYCLCEDGVQALCNPGDHYSNGMLGAWSKNLGVTRNNSWSQCQHEGG